MDIQKDLLSIKDCVKEYGIAITTLRRWIKKGELPASLVDTQYVIHRNELENLLARKNISRPKTTVDTQEVSMTTHIDTQVDTLKKENEYLKEKISSLERTIATLERDKEFLQGQVQQLTNTISLLTTKQLSEPRRFIDKVKDLFRKG